MPQTLTESELRRVVETYSPMLLRVAMTRAPSPADAEDVVQDVFLRLLTRTPRFRDGEHEKAWLLALPVPTVRTRLARGRDRLREMLKEEELV